MIGLEVNYVKSVNGLSERWARRFMIASVIHGIGFAVWTALFLLDGIGFQLNLSRIIAGGGVGTWFTVGYLLYLITGFVGMAVLGTLYYLTPRLFRRELYSDKLALAHFALMNIAVVSATWMLGMVGFQGRSLGLAGREAEIHGAVVAYVVPIGYSLVIGVGSVLAYAANILMTARKGTLKPTPSSMVRERAPPEFGLDEAPLSETPSSMTG